MWHPPDSNAEIDECLRWYSSVLKWRKRPKGVPEPIELHEIKTAYGIYDTWVDIEYLSDVVNAIDDVYIRKTSEMIRTHQTP